jgi:Xaa-Pro dipeptidase
MKRRVFLAAAAAGMAGAARAQQQQPPAAIPDSIRNLQPMTAGIQPITDDERRARIEKARRLMRENRIGAVVMEGGSSLYYFTGARWPQSTPLAALVLPAAGDMVWVVPEADAERARGAIKMGGEVRTWKDDEGPYKKLAQALKDRGAGKGSVAFEERVRFAVFDGLRKETPGTEFTSGDPVTVGCRVIKSPAELALMQRANDITVAAYKASFAVLREGMTQRELSAIISAAYRALGANGNAMVMFGKYTAFPHGSTEPQTLREGDFVLVDDGCTVEGYQSDITRTVIFGKPTERQKQVWALERKAQDAALAAAKPGRACETVDYAARKVITDAGFGPDYRVPGLPHRTGHGIGLDGHEWTNFVRGNKTPMQPGMCFSDEPMIAIYGEFGIRLEDCLYITEDGARTFSKQAPAIDQPF